VADGLNPRPTTTRALPTELPPPRADIVVVLEDAPEVSNTPGTDFFRRYAPVCTARALPAVSARNRPCRAPARRSEHACTCWR
jgi:hypothetical protein